MNATQFIIYLFILGVLFLRPKFIRDFLGDELPIALGVVAVIVIGIQFIFLL